MTRKLLLIVPLLLVAASCRTSGGEDRALLEEITAANRRLEELFRAGDMLGVADAYDADGIVLGPGDFRREGREEIDLYWSRIHEPIDWRLEVHEVRGAEGLATQLGTSHLTISRDGEPHTTVVDFALVWRRDAKGVWRILVDAYWTPPPE